MDKVSRKETKELAALILTTIKKARPDLKNRQIRCACSALYAQLKDEKVAK